MKILAMTAAAAMLAMPAFAQQTVTAGTTTGLYTSAADVAAAVAKLPQNPLASVPVFKMGPFNVNVEHRLGSPAAPQAASVHEKDAELFYTVGVSAYEIVAKRPELSVEQKRDLVRRGLAAFDRAESLRTDYFEAMVYRSLPYPDADRLVFVWGHRPASPMPPR